MSTIRLRYRLGWVLVGFSLFLHLITLYTFGRQPDAAAAFTVLPIWFWGAIGLIAAIFAFWALRAPLSLVMTGVWLITILLGADEARSLFRFANPPPLPGPAQPFNHQPVLRVLTLNCRYFDYNGGSDPTADIVRWNPDIVLLQEIPAHRVKPLAQALYQGQGDSRIHYTNAIITRGTIIREIRSGFLQQSAKGYQHQQVTIRLPDQREFEVANLHLSSAVTDLRLWRRECWQLHRHHRQNRRSELSVSHALINYSREGRPAIFAGDFNSPPTDPSLFILRSDFKDAFAAVGSGWGNTFQRRIPVIRIDQIHASSQLIPIRCAAVTTSQSDHRMVVADFLAP